jgi:hypothetical protein
MNKTGNSVAELMEERTLTKRQMGREFISIALAGPKGEIQGSIS